MLTSRQAFDDRSRRLLLHNLGHLAPPLLKRSARRVHIDLGLDLLAPGDRSNKDVKPLCTR